MELWFSTFRWFFGPLFQTHTMYGIIAYIGVIFMLNVGKNIPYMDAAAMGKWPSNRIFSTLVLPQVDKAAAEKYKAEVETRTVALGCGTTSRGSKVFFFWLQMKKKKNCAFFVLGAFSPTRWAPNSYKWNIYPL